MSDKRKNKIKITVFMAAYNAADYIATSIESVLTQTYPHFELLIVDDGSTDNTIQIAQSFDDSRVRLIENGENKGLPFTRNVALEEAQGEFIAVLDSDDIAFRNRLEIQLQHFLDRPKLALLGACAYIIDKDGNRTGEKMIPICDSEKLHAELLFHNSFVHSTVMFRTAVFREMGGYPNHPVAQDYGLFSRIALKYEVDNIPQYLGEYRIHDNNITDRKRHLADTQLRAILFYQLDKLISHADDIELDILRKPVIGSKYTPKEYHALYTEIILQNRKRKQYPIKELEQILYNNWYMIVMEKGKSKTFPLLLRNPIFNRRYVTAKQIRKTFKQSLKYLLGIIS
ncbi:glycosyltransferase [Sphingobacterium corticibacterium]|uniref:Glycosyltransferase n=2 Tax=Sphingobacterium corticibacterium TaxID=2484746 RepID=A0A4Q6XSN5_9SPHI|nr:glycosyltransferase [Sphingobacterium corticibacterium]